MLHGNTNRSLPVSTAGAPDNVSFTTDISVSNSSLVLLDLTIRDRSSAPARQFDLSIPDISYNLSITPGAPAVNWTYTGLVNKNLSLFGSSGKYHLVINASNSIGSVVYNELLDIPVMCEYLPLLPLLVWVSVCLSVHLYVCLFICMSVCLFVVCLSVCLFCVCLSVCLFICLYVCLFVCMSVYLFVCLFVCCMSVWFFVVCLSVCLFICLYVCLFVCLFVYLFVCLFDCLLYVCLFICCMFVSLFIYLFVCLFVVSLYICPTLL